MRIKVGMGLLIMGLSLGIGQWAASGESRLFESREEFSKGGVSPVTNTLYAEECGACHFAYQPGLLPARSWGKIMATLSDHFGDNAELDPKEQQGILHYLQTSAADRSSKKRSIRIVRTLKANLTPIRISKLPYILRQHDEIPKRLIQGNPEVSSLSNCNSCHTQATSGVYEENTVRIPGVGKWDD